MTLAEVFTRGDAGDVVRLAVTVGVPLLLVALAFLPPTSRYVRRWAASRGLELTDANRGLVLSYIKRTHRLRTVGGALGFLIFEIPGTLYNLVDPASELGRTLVRLAMSSGNLVGLILGYLAGALVAEFTLARPHDGQRSRATLSPREVTQYVTPWARHMLWGFAAVLVLAIPLPAILTFEQNTAELPSVGRYAATAAVGLAIVALVEWLQRMIVRRRQRFVDPDVVAADDAVRSSSVHACLGVGLTLVMAMVGGVLLELSSDAVLDPVRWILTGPAIICMIGPLVVWLSFGTSYAWTVRRRPALGPAQTQVSA